MKSAEEYEESRIYLMGQIAYLAQSNDWKKIEQLIAQRDKEDQLDAFKAGMEKAAGRIKRAIEVVRDNKVEPWLGLREANLLESMASNILTISQQLTEVPKV